MTFAVTQDSGTLRTVSVEASNPTSGRLAAMGLFPGARDAKRIRTRQGGTDAGNFPRAMSPSE